MAINKKLIHFKLKSSFETELANNNILDTSIVFIQETKEIWTHGQLYKCSDPDLSNYVKESELQELLSPIQSSLANKLEVSDLAGYAKTSDIPAVVTDSTVSNWGFIKTSDANETYAPKSLVETVSNQSTTISTLATKNELSTGLAGKLDNSAASSFVPTTRTINGTALTADIWITATDPNAATKEELNGLATTVANKAEVSALANFATTDALSSGLSGKQETLVSGTNIKTIEGQSILGSGDIQITAAEVGAYTTWEIDAKVTALNNAISGKVDPSTVTAVSDRVSTLEGYFSTAEDSDATINKWGEIVNFLDGVAEGSNVEQLLAAKANQSALNDLSTTVSNVDAKFANYLPLSGGILGDSWGSGTEIRRKDSNNGYASLTFSQEDGTILGRFGFGGVDNPLFITQAGGYNTLLHSGNVGEYAITPSTIGSQSVAYASNAGYAGYATSSGNADTLGGNSASDFTRFYLSPMGADAPADSAKGWFTNTMPYGSGAIVYNVPGSEKTIIAGKSSADYGHMLQLNYDDNYPRLLRYQGGSWKTDDWEKISAGYADTSGYAASAGTANSVAWDNVSGKPSFATVATSGSYNDLTNKPTIPTNTNQLTNGAGFITSASIPSSLPANGGNADTVDGQHFSYSNEADAPTWVWATNENGTSFLAKRANLSVNYANSAGSATDQTARDAAATAQSTANGKWTWNANDVAGVKVNNAEYADRAGSIAWDNVSGRPSSLPASDVYAWAKASSKPSYNFGEIGAGTAIIGDGANRLMFRTNEGYLSGIYYSTPGNESLVFANGNAVTSWIFATANPNSQGSWYDLTPSLQIKNQCVVINKLIPNDTYASYNLDVNGSFNATTGYINGSAIITSANIGSQSVNYANSAGSATNATNATNATYATYDSNGNYIVDNYATKAEIPSIPSSLPANGGTATNAYNDQNGSNIVNTYATKDWVSSNFNYSTDTWRPITDSYSGSEQGTSLSQYGANALYNALVNGYAAEAGYASSAGSANSVAWSNVSGRPTSVSQFTNDSGYFNTSSVWNNPENVTLDTTIGPTEMYNSLQGFINNGTVVVKNGTLYVMDNPNTPVSTHWLDAWSDPNTYGGVFYNGQITLDLYPDRFYDVTHNPLISTLTINSISGWNNIGLISHNIVRFKPGSSAFTLTLPSGIYWANGNPIECDDPDSIYEISFIKRSGGDEITATWTKFTQA